MKELPGRTAVDFRVSDSVFFSLDRINNKNNLSNLTQTKILNT